MRTLLPLASLVLTLAPPALAAPISVAVIDDSTDGSEAQLQDQLLDSVIFDFEVSIVDASSITSGSDLSSYDVVIVGDSGYSDAIKYAPSFTAAMVAYNESGGGVIYGSWASYSGGVGIDPLVPIDQASATSGYCSGPTTVQMTATEHAITAGVDDFSDTSTYTETPGPLATGAVLLATGSCNTEAVVAIAEPTGSGRQAYLGLIMVGNEASYANTDLRSGEADQLIEQAVAWAGGCSDADGDGAWSCGTDCDDTDAARFPGNPEICDGLDNDCDEAVPADELDDDDDGVSTCEGDCDDGDDLRFPGNTEVCDGIDNDCNDDADDGLEVLSLFEDADGDGEGDASKALQTCDATAGVSNDDDCDDGDAAINTGAEEIAGNDIDEDCDGEAQGGCGCSSTPTSGVLWLPALLALGALWRRRRR